MVFAPTYNSHLVRHGAQIDVTEHARSHLRAAVSVIRRDISARLLVQGRGVAGRPAVEASSVEAKIGRGVVRRNEISIMIENVEGGVAVGFVVTYLTYFRNLVALDENTAVWKGSTTMAPFFRCVFRIGPPKVTVVGQNSPLVRAPFVRYLSALFIICIFTVQTFITSCQFSLRLRERLRSSLSLKRHGQAK